MKALRHALPLLALLATATLAAQPASRPQWMKGPNWPEPVFDKAAPTLPESLPRPAILVFSKTNGFRDDAQIKASGAAIAGLVEARGWGVFVTENAAVFNPKQLARFDALVFSSTSGDLFTPEQRLALQAYIKRGGGFVGLHGAGGDPHYDWPWYVETLIGAQFIGHTNAPDQFQAATIRIEDRTHPATRHLPSEWRWTEEWYSFQRSPRSEVNVLASVDEAGLTYDPKLRMGADHPLIWWQCEGRARLFYSALGHKAGTYSDPNHLKLIDGAIAWAARKDGDGCD